MKKLFIANWKLNKTIQDVSSWYEAFETKFSSLELNSSEYEIVVASSHVLLEKSYSASLKSQFGIKTAAQDVSQFLSGAYTGENSVRQVRDFVSYVIIGHSERRVLCDTNEIVLQKVKNVLAEGLIPIICFSKIEEINFVRASIGEEFNKCEFAYEPLYAIGSGNSADEDEVATVFNNTELKNMIYGGSVNSDSIKKYANLPFISGYLIGSASLNPGDFSDTINSAINY